MGLWSLLTGVASVALALNIGANNSAAEMGPAYGAGARSRRQSLVLIAVFCTLGAILAGDRVLHTISHGLVKGGGFAGNPVGALVVVISAACLIAAANALRIPVSTAHVVVGATIGLGLYYGSANLPLAGRMVAWWIVTPVSALLISYMLGRSAYPWLIKTIGSLRSEAAVYRIIRWSLTLSGCWMAFSAGSNSLAKAMGPAVGTGVFSVPAAAVFGGLGMAFGALLFGGRTLNTVGREITRICPLCAAMIEVVSASIVFTASRSGMPVSLAEIVTCSVIGFSMASNGLRGTTGNQHVRRMLVLWPAAPVTACAIAFGLLALRVGF